MEGFEVRNVLVAGGDVGAGPGLVEAFVRLPRPPRLLFATCRHPNGPGAQALKEMSLRDSKGCTLVVLQLDVTDPESIKEAAEKVAKQVGRSGLNLLLNNLTVTHDTMLETENAQSMAAVYTTNTIGPLLVCQAFLPLLRNAAWANCWSKLSCTKAAIVNLSSSRASLSLVDGWREKQDVGYRCSKEDLGMAARARGMLEVLSRLSSDDNGAFLDWRGQAVPW